MSKAIAWIVGILILLLLVLFSTTYTVSFNEVAIVSRFGKPAEVVREPGLKFKAPFFIDQVTTLDKRMQLVESPELQRQTEDNQAFVVETYLIWRIDPELAMSFHNQFGSLEAAAASLDEQLEQAMSEISRFRFDELLGETDALNEAEDAILAQLRQTAPAGIDAVSVGISQLALPPTTSRAVLRRMKTSQDTLAENERERGNAAAGAIRTNADTQATKIRQFARRLAEELKAEGSAEAAKYLAQMKEAKDLAIFLTWLNTFEAGLQQQTAYIGSVLDAPFHLFNRNAEVDEYGIPQPVRSRIKQEQETVATSETGSQQMQPREQDENPDEEQSQEEGS